MISQSAFPDPLITRFYDTRHGQAIFIVSHFFRYIKPPIEVTVPTGFPTDGASIPRVFHSIIGPTGPYFPAAIIHDFLYSTKSNRCHPAIDRACADRIFLSAMKDCGVGWITRQTIYRAVRMFGWKFYKRGE